MQLELINFLQAADGQSNLKDLKWAKITVERRGYKFFFIIIYASYSCVANINLSLYVLCIFHETTYHVENIKQQFIDMQICALCSLYSIYIYTLTQYNNV